jgi:hypothetical protein
MARITAYPENTNPTSDDWILTVDKTTGKTKKAALSKLGLGGFSIPFVFDASTEAGNPGTGKFRYSADYSHVYLSDVDANGGDSYDWLSMVDGDYTFIFFRKISDPSCWVITMYQDYSDEEGYIAIEITSLMGTEVVPSAGDEFVVEMIWAIVGETGENGQGVPAGGSTGQFLEKASATDFHTQWQSPAWRGKTHGTPDPFPEEGDFWYDLDLHAWMGWDGTNFQTFDITIFGGA